jgi:hypothetical protein
MPGVSELCLFRSGGFRGHSHWAVYCLLERRGNYDLARTNCTWRSCRGYFTSCMGNFVTCSVQCSCCGSFFPWHMYFGSVLKINAAQRKTFLICTDLLCVWGMPHTSAASQVIVMWDWLNSWLTCLAKPNLFLSYTQVTDCRFTPQNPAQRMYSEVKV